MSYWKNLSIGRRITVGFLSVVLLTIACAVTGWLGVSRLDQALEYVTGPAWSTADGAMEGSIGIEAQMLAVERYVGGFATEAEASAMLDEGIATEIDALGRMEAAGLIEASRVQRLQALRESFRSVRERLWAARQDEQVSPRLTTAYMKAANELLEYIESVEEIGDAQVEGKMESIRSSTDAAYLIIAVVAVVAMLAAALVGYLIVGSVTAPIAESVRVAERIGQGNLSQEINAGDGKDESASLLRALAKMQTDLRERIEREQRQVLAQQAEQRSAEQELERVLDDAIHGRLSSRLNTSNMEGFLQTVGIRINHMLDAIVSPLSESASCLARLSRGDIPEQLRSSYEGDFNEIRTNLNQCIQAVANLVADSQRLALAVGQGKLDVKVDVSRHQGSFRRIIEAMDQAFGKVVAPIQETRRVMAALASGDLTETMRGSYEGEFAQMQASVDDSLARVRGLIIQIRSGAEFIRASSSEISSGNVDLSHRTESQAESVQKSSTSIVNLTELIRNNAAKARDAERMSESTVVAAKQASEVVGRAVTAMAEIDRASKEISDIIGVVDDIAFQTNLLALNAAIEAARAGEQGRGFAVVAGEVRNLAQRSADAARKIKELIEASVRRVEEGSSLVQTTGSTFDRIAQSVISVSGMIGSIAAESDTQYAGIESASRALLEIEQNTQRNAALVEEVAATSQSLDQQSIALHQVVESFRT